MPVLPSLPQADIKQFYLPSTASLPQDEQAWVKMDVSPVNVQDFLAVNNEDEDNMTRLGMQVFAERIKEWNFTEADGKPVPIDIKSIIRIGVENLSYLSQQMPKDEVQLTVTQKKS